jgi:hypothetical protein
VSWTALVGPSRHSYSFRQWVETSVLYLNAESEMAASVQELLQLPGGSSVGRYIPRIVHNYALLFSIADFSYEWETQIWGDVRELVELLRHSTELERTIESGAATREALNDALAEIERLEGQIASLKGLLGLPVSFELVGGTR